MSRYKSGDYEYGYDRPLQEYFLQKVESNPEEDFPEIVELVGSLSSVRGTAMNLLKFIEQHQIKIPQEHRDLILMDLPF